ncbi:unnamed protein product, partial [Closterium sp. NIES-53]
LRGHVRRPLSRHHHHQRIFPRPLVQHQPQTAHAPHLALLPLPLPLPSPFPLPLPLLRFPHNPPLHQVTQVAPQKHNPTLPFLPPLPSAPAIPLRRPLRNLPLPSSFQLPLKRNQPPEGLPLRRPSPSVPPLTLPLPRFQPILSPSPSALLLLRAAASPPSPSSSAYPPLVRPNRGSGGDGAKDAALADAEAGGEAAATEGMEVDGGEVGEGEATAEGAAEAAAEEAEVEAEAEGELEGGEEEDELREVPVQFSSAEEYVDVFERLLLEECRAQILRGAEEQGAGGKGERREGFCVCA